jgi:hypothetical protein
MKPKRTNCVRNRYFGNVNDDNVGPIEGEEEREKQKDVAMTTMTSTLDITRFAKIQRIDESNKGHAPYQTPRKGNHEHD